MSFLDSRINYEKLCAADYTAQEFKLERVEELHRRLGAPADGMPIVHVTGTKGKGSTAAMIARIFQESGRKVGFFQSPHFTDIGERFLVNGVPCSGEELAALVAEVQPVVEEMDRETAAGNVAQRSDRIEVETGSAFLSGHSRCASFPATVTWFEIITMIALLHFRRQGVDAAVLEVGMGGRLDATNICSPLVSVITSVSLDHTQQLGGTLPEIAYEKAGIIKPAVPVVSGVLEPSAKAVVEKIAEIRCAEIFRIGEDFTAEISEAERNVFRFESSRPSVFTESYHVGMPGRHQAQNAALAVTAAAILREKYGFSIPSEAVHTALRDTRLPGRLELWPGAENVILDVAHNEASLAAAMDFLRETFPTARKHFIFAVSGDKDWRTLLEKLTAEADTLFLTEYHANSRFTPVETLVAYCRELHTSAEIHAFRDPREALQAAFSRKKPGDVLMILGSFFLVAEVMGVLRDFEIMNGSRDWSATK